jgi:DNA-binding transcriptional MerR regulator
MTIVYKPSDVMKQLDIKESLYKKYIAALEKDGGHVFQKNQQGHRIFTAEDIQILEKFMELIKYDGMTIEKVAKKIGEMNSHDAISKEEPNSYDVMALVEQAVSSALKVQEKQLHDVMTAIANQNNELKEQLKRIEDKHDKVFVQSLRESQENKKLMLEEVKTQVKSEIAAAKEEKKKWWQFGK